MEIISMSYHKGNIRKWRDIAHILWCTLIALQSENYTAQKTEDHADNEITESDQKTPDTVVQIIQVLHHPFMISRQGDLIIQFPSNPFSPECMKYANIKIWMHQEEKEGNFLTANTGLSLPLPPLKVRGRECIFWGENKASW
jgi:hypothetical protein